MRDAANSLNTLNMHSQHLLEDVLIKIELTLAAFEEPGAIHFIWHLYSVVGYARGNTIRRQENINSSRYTIIFETNMFVYFILYFKLTMLN